MPCCSGRVRKAEGTMRGSTDSVNSTRLGGDGEGGTGRVAGCWAVVGFSSLRFCSDLFVSMSFFSFASHRLAGLAASDRTGRARARITRDKGWAKQQGRVEYAETGCLHREESAEHRAQGRAEPEPEAEGRERGRAARRGGKGDEPLGQQRGTSASAIWPRRACLAGPVWASAPAGPWTVRMCCSRLETPFSLHRTVGTGVQRGSPGLQTARSLSVPSGERVSMHTRWSNRPPSLVMVNRTHVRWGAHARDYAVITCPIPSRAVAPVRTADNQHHAVCRRLAIHSSSKGTPSLAHSRTHSTTPQRRSTTWIASVLAPHSPSPAAINGG